jgi:hypothetical protein
MTGPEEWSDLWGFWNRLSNFGRERLPLGRTSPGTPLYTDSLYHYMHRISSLLSLINNLVVCTDQEEHHVLRVQGERKLGECMSYAIQLLTRNSDHGL